MSYELFGQWLYKGQKSLCICEGEEDCVAMDHMINDELPKGMKTLCVSLPTGANIKGLKDNMDFIEKFSRVTFSADQDEAGLKIVEPIASLFPNMRFFDMSEKDASAMLMAGKQQEFVRSYNKADKYSPPAIVDIDTIIGSLDEYVPMGLSYPWQNVTNVTYGIVPHQIVSVGSGPGAGKSSVVRAVQQHLMFNHKLPIGSFSLEDNTETALRYLVGYLMNERIHIPGSTYDKEKAKEIAMSLRDKAFFFDNRYFKGDFSAIEKAIRYLHANGVNHFFIDPVSALAAHLSASDGNTYINAIMIELSRLIQELPIYIMLVNHLNNPVSGKAHDEGGRVLPSQFTGSKGQWRYSTDMWGFERNLLSLDEDEKNTMLVRNLKHRADGSKTGKVCKLHYNGATGRLEEEDSAFTAAPSTVTPAVIAKMPMIPKLTKPRASDENDDDDSLADMMGG